MSTLGLFDVPEQVEQDGPIVDCGLCTKDSAIYELGRLCCRVRLLMKEPRKEVRKALLERWQRKDRAGAKRVEDEVRMRWQQKKGARNAEHEN